MLFSSYGSVSFFYSSSSIFLAIRHLSLPNTANYGNIFSPPQNIISPRVLDSPETHTYVLLSSHGRDRKSGNFLNFMYNLHFQENTYKLLYSPGGRATTIYRHSHNFVASKSRDQRILFSSGTAIRGFWSSKFVKGSIGCLVLPQRARHLLQFFLFYAALFPDLMFAWKDPTGPFTISEP